MELFLRVCMSGAGICVYLRASMYLGVWNMFAYGCLHMGVYVPEFATVGCSCFVCGYLYYLNGCLFRVYVKVYMSLCCYGFSFLIILSDGHP